MPRKLEVILGVTDRATKNIQRVEGKFRRFATRTKAAMRTLLSIPSLIAGAAVIKLGGAFVGAAAKIDLFRKQLVAVTASAAEADQKLAAIREFARTSPLETEDVIRSFVKLRAVGIDPTMDQMRTLGGVAVLFGKQLEEVLDSFIGLNKRTLRRLGVEIDRTGRQAVIASGNIRKVVEKDSASIRAALLEVWAERFPNAIETASGTFKAKVAIMRSNVFEFMARLTANFLPMLTGIVNNVADVFALLAKHANQIAAVIMAIILPVRILKNGFDLLFQTLLITGRFAINSFFMGLDTIRTLLQLIAETAKGTGKIILAAVTGDWAAIGDIWSDAFSTMGGKILDLQQKATRARESMAVDARQLGDTWDTELGNIGQAMADVVTTWEKGVQKIEAADLGGTGATGAVEQKEQMIGLLKAQIEFLKMRIEANKKAAQLVIASIEDEFVRRRVIINTGLSEELAQIDRWLQMQVITEERANEMRVNARAKAAHEIAAIEEAQTEKHRKASEERIEQERAEARARFDVADRITTQLIDLAQNALSSSRRNARERQNILAGIAIAEGAAAAVTGIATVWQDESINSTAAKIIMSIVVAAGIIASTAAYISDIREQSFARGTHFAPGGSALVGEEGPEFVNVPRGAQVMTAPETRQLIGGATISPTIVIQGNADDATVAKIGNTLEQFALKMRESVRLGYLDMATL